MNRHRTVTQRAKAYGLIAAALLGTATVTALAGREVAVERAEARSLSVEAQTEFEKGRPAEAVLALERARLLAPRADFVRSALDERRVRSAEPPIARAVGWITPREWSSLALTLGWIAGLGLAVTICRKGKSRWARRLAVGSGAAFMLSTAGFVESNHTGAALAVVKDATGLLVAPYDGAGATAAMPAGVVVAVGARYGDFVQVRGSDGAQGWVTSSVLESVVGARI